jgi:hypothetical protein
MLSIIKENDTQLHRELCMLVFISRFVNKMVQCQYESSERYNFFSNGKYFTYKTKVNFRRTKCDKGGRKVWKIYT